MRIRKRKPIGKKTIKYIEKLYGAYSRKLFYIAKNHVKDDDLAQDVVQSVFEKALVYPEGILKVPEKEVFYFLTAITKNESFTLLKNEKNNEHESLTYEDGSEGDFVDDFSFKGICVQSRIRQQVSQHDGVFFQLYTKFFRHLGSSYS